MKALVKALRSAFPDFKVNIERQIAEGDLVCTVADVTGTMKGDMGPMKATNKTMNVQLIDIVKIKDGKATDRWGAWDQMKMMQQLGFMPPMGAPPAGETKKM